MKKVIFFMVAVFAVNLLNAAPKPDAEAKKLLSKFAEKGKMFRPASGKTSIFARGLL